VSSGLKLWIVSPSGLQVQASLPSRKTVESVVRALHGGRHLNFSPRAGSEGFSDSKSAPGTGD
jgi:hypothetical protein